MLIDSLPRSYSEFRPVVNDIKLNNSTARFLGGGAESTVWCATLGSQDYAIKIANELSIRGRKRDTYRATEAKVLSGLRGLGVPGLEQIQAASLEDGVAVYNFVNGINASELTEEDMRDITQRHVLLLRQTVSVATRAGIMIDGWNKSGSNAFFAAEVGFTLIDYWATDSRSVSEETNWLYTVRSLGSIGLKLLDF